MTITLPNVVVVNEEPAPIVVIATQGPAGGVPFSAMGAPNGVATLDSGGFVPLAQLPDQAALDAEIAAAVAAEAVLRTNADALVVHLAGTETITGLKTIIPASAATAGVIVKGFASQTANLQEWQSSAGTVLAKINAAGVFTGPSTAVTYVEDGTQAGPYLQLSPASVYLLNRTGVGNTAFVVRGMAGQTGDLQQWQNSAGTVLAFVQQNGAIGLTGDTAFQGKYLTAIGGVNGAYILTNPAGGLTVIARTNAAYVPLVVKGMAAQTGDLQQWQDSAGLVLARMTPNVNSGVMLQIGNASLPNGIAGNVKLTAESLTQIALIYAPAGVEEWYVYQAGTGSLYVRDMVNAKMQMTFTKGTAGNAATTVFDRFHVKAGAAQSNDLQKWQNSAGSDVARMGVGGSLALYPGGVSSTAFSVGVIGDAQQRFRMDENGACWWGPGGATVGDTNLYRSAADTLKTDDNFIVLGAFSINPSGTGTLNLGDGQITKTPGSGFEFNTGFATAYAKIGGTGTPAAKLDVIGAVAGTVVLLVKGAASQSADLQQWQSSAAAILASISSLGYVTTPQLILKPGGTLRFFRSDGVTEGFNLTAGTANNFITVTTGGFIVSGPMSVDLSASQVFTIRKADGSINRLYVSDATGRVGINNGGPGAQLQIDAGIATNVGLIVKGFASQSVDLQQWQDSAGVAVARVGSGGGFVSVGATATQFYKDGAPNYASSIGQNIPGVAVTNDMLFGVYNSGAGWKEVLRLNNSGGATLQNITTVGNVVLTVKGAVSQTASLQQWQDSTGAIKLRVEPDGGIIAYVGITVPDLIAPTFAGPYITLDGASVFIRNRTTAGNVPLIVKGMAGQTGNLQQWQDSAGTVLARMFSNGSMVTGPIGVSGGILALTMLSVYAAWTDYVPIVARGYAGQVADLQQWQNSAGTVLAKMTAIGGMVVTTGSFGSAGDAIASGSIIDAAAASDTALKVRRTGGGTAYLTAKAAVVEFGSANNVPVQMFVNGVKTLEMVADASIADTETAILVRRNVGGVFTSERVSMGAADSAGAGFKTLRVPN